MNRSFDRSKICLNIYSKFVLFKRLNCLSAAKYGFVFAIFFVCSTWWVVAIASNSCFLRAKKSMSFSKFTHFDKIGWAFLFLPSFSNGKINAGRNIDDAVNLTQPNSTPGFCQTGISGIRSNFYNHFLLNFTFFSAWNDLSDFFIFETKNYKVVGRSFKAIFF